MAAGEVGDGGSGTGPVRARSSRPRRASPGRGRSGRRATRAEEILKGQRPTHDLFGQAIDAELEAADPVEGTEFKIPMARGAVTTALGELCRIPAHPDAKATDAPTEGDDD